MKKNVVKIPLYNHDGNALSLITFENRTITHFLQMLNHYRLYSFVIIIIMIETRTVNESTTELFLTTSSS